MRIPRMTTRRLMIVVALSALTFWQLSGLRRAPHYQRLASLHATLAELCQHEETLMRRRAEACAARWRCGAAWDETGEEAEMLRCGPYANDVPRYGSWDQQAAIWDRAADRARMAAGWHERMSRYYDHVGPALMPARPR